MNINQQPPSTLISQNFAVSEHVLSIIILSTGGERCMSLGKRVKDRRLQLGYSGKKLAEKVEIKQSHLSEIENNKKGASSTTIANLANALFTTSDYLLELDDNEVLRIPKETNPELVKKIEYLIFCYNKGINPSNK